MTADKADALIAKYPFYTKLTNCSQNLPRIQEADVQAIAVRAMLAVTDKMDADTGYAITKAIFSNLDRLKAAHSVANAVSKAIALDGMSVPVNPGAEKYLKEK